MPLYNRKRSKRKEVEQKNLMICHMPLYNRKRYKKNSSTALKFHTSRIYIKCHGKIKNFKKIKEVISDIHFSIPY